MYKENAIVDFLKENNVNPKKGLDVCCGNGSLVSVLSSEYQKGEFHGLDLNRMDLAHGIAKGNFKKAVPIHGNAYQLPLGSNFTEVNLDPKYYKGSSVDWTKLEHRKLKYPLAGYDLVTAVNPVCRLTSEEVNSLIRGESTNKNSVPLSTISSPAEKHAKIAYVEEIAQRYAALYGGATPKTLIERQTQMRLEDLKRRGKSSGLEFIEYATIGDRNSNSIDLAVLFKKG